MEVVADLHLHSRFSRAVSQNMTFPTLQQWAIKKGIDLVGTGDFTHPIWFREIKSQLEEIAPGIYKLRVAGAKKDASFMLTTELSCIYSQGGKTRKIHLVILAPNFITVEKINRGLVTRGFNLLSDGRPILGISAKNLTEFLLAIDENILIIPAHVWTPWFSLYGANSGFDSIEECFGNLSSSIFAVETGLSSDPAMNWRIDELISRKIVSFSDAHSPQKMGREATVFDLESLCFGNIRSALINPSVRGKNKIVYTIEFYPEEGKYHYTGHRNCKIIYSANETKKLGNVCPVCGKTLTVGVTSRVEHLASREIEIETQKDKLGVSWIGSKQRKCPSYIMLVPLIEIIAESLNVGSSSQKVQDLYEKLINSFESEFNVLIETETEDIKKVAGARLAEGIAKVRSGDIVIEPGYDGVFGKVKIWKKGETQELTLKQNTLF